MRNEEFSADVCLVSRRVLSEAEYRVFKFHYLLGADWKLCCKKLATDRGTFFHAVYRVEERLGRAFAEVEPYSLWPLDEYFNGVVKGAVRHPLFAVESEKDDKGPSSKLRFPLRASLAGRAA